MTQDPSLLRDLELLVEPVTRGDLESPLLWTCKSLPKLAQELQRMRHRTSHQLVGRMLHDLGYSLQANSKTPGRLQASRPKCSVRVSQSPSQVPDTAAPARYLRGHEKGKKLVGDFSNNGPELRPKGDREKVRVHDFIIPAAWEGRAPHDARVCVEGAASGCLPGWLSRKWDWLCSLDFFPACTTARTLTKFKISH